jgi:DNA-directed RNA polymerase subunit RPC12/RpoP
MEATKTGKWIKVSVDPDKVRWMCSSCGKETDLPNYEKANFCFNCGTEMMKERTDE